MNNQPKALTISGWVLAGLVSAFLLTGVVMSFFASGEMKQKMIDESARMGFPSELMGTLVCVELASVLLYLFPPTAVLGAILLTGYLGGAVCVHVRIHDPFLMPVAVGVVVWLALFLRDPQVRALLPWKRPA